MHSCKIYTNFDFPSRNISYVSTDLLAIFVCRWSISGWSKLEIPSHAAGNENDEIRYRLRLRHASWGETIFRRVDEQFSVETKCFKKWYGNSLCWISDFMILSVGKSSYYLLKRYHIILDYILAVYKTRIKIFLHMTNRSNTKINHIYDKNIWTELWKIPGIITAINYITKPKTYFLIDNAFYFKFWNREGELCEHKGSILIYNIT